MTAPLRSCHYRAVATAVAIALAAYPAWGHNAPAVRTVVVQVERCEVVLLVGYREASGEASRKLAARAASHPKSKALDAMRDVMAAQAMAPLTVTVDGVALVPTAVRAKLGTEGGEGGRPMVVVLVSYPLGAGSRLSIGSKDPRSTRISWTDRASSRVSLVDVPAQGRWFVGVASFLLTLAPTPGGPPCARVRPSPSP